MDVKYQERHRVLSLSFLKTSLLIVMLFIFYSCYIGNKFICPEKVVTPRFNGLIHRIRTISHQNLSSRSDLIRCVVYVTQSGGRLGNRMFLVASAYGLARLHSCHLYLLPNIVRELSSIFIANFSSILISQSTFDLLNNQKTNSHIVQKDIVCQYYPELSRPNAISKGQFFHVTGFWQSYLYFIKYETELRNHIFIGTPNILQKISQIFADIYYKKYSIKAQLNSHHHLTLKQQLIDLDGIVWIGIHIRRGDFIGLQFSSSDTYILNAIKYFTERYANAHFIVASDDKSYCQNLLQNRTIVTITPDSFSIADDLITLSLCEHSIITGGTFSWWSGFLAGGEVLHDVIYPSGCEKREHYYPPWYLIDGYVRAHKNSNFSL